MLPNALWLLMRLRLNGWMRRIGLNMSTTKGALLTIFSAMIILSWLISVFVSAFATPRHGMESELLQYVERFGPFGLLAYCMLMSVTAGGSSPVNFSLTEVQFLFSAPFTRRQLLAYKLISQFLLTLPFGLFMTFATRSMSGSILSAFVGVVLILMFLQLFGMSVNFMASTLGELTYSRTRKLVFGVGVFLLAVAVVEILRAQAAPASLLELMERIEQSPVVQTLLTPLRWFVRALTAQYVWPDLVQWSAVALTVNVSLLVLVFVLDASYLESAAVMSERRYERIQRARSGGIAGAAVRTGKVRYTLPTMPWLGGIGPIAWRQLVAAMRGYRPLLVFTFAFAAGILIPLIVSLTQENTDATLPWLLSGIGLFMSFVMSQLFAFDFRADVDRIEVLKTLPLPAWRIALGQMFTPVLFATIFQISLVGAVYALFGSIGVLFAAVMVLAPPLNLLMTGVDNLLFLLFPTRMVQSTPGDLSQAGRSMLQMFAKMAALVVGAGVPVLFGLGAFVALGENWIAAFAAAAVPCYAVSLAPIPLVASAFRRFDVSRDTPP